MKECVTKRGSPARLRGSIVFQLCNRYEGLNRRSDKKVSCYVFFICIFFVICLQAPLLSKTIACSNEKEETEKRNTSFVKFYEETTRAKIIHHNQIRAGVEVSKLPLQYTLALYITKTCQSSASFLQFSYNFASVPHSKKKHLLLGLNYLQKTSRSCMS